MNPENTQDNPTQSEAASAPSPEDGFDAAVAEFAAEASAPARDAAADDLESKPQGADDQPAPSQDAAEPLAAGDKPPASSTPDDSDIWTNADPRLRKAHEDAIRDAQLRIEGIKGRQSKADKEVQRLRERLAQLEAQQGTGNRTEQHQAGSEEAAPAKSTDDRLDKLREDYPDIAGPLVDMIEAQAAKIGELEKPIGNLQQEREQAYYAAQERVLSSTHPDYREVINADLDRYNGWLASQPKVIQEIAVRNEHHVVDGAEVALLVGKFKADLGITAPSAPPPSPAIDERREAQKASGRDAGRTGPSVTTGVPDDFDAAVAYYSARA